MIARFFHRWEEQLAASTTNRVVRPFEWGLDWLPESLAHQNGAAPVELLSRLAERAVTDSDAFYAVTPAPHYELDRAGRLTFESAYASPHAENNVVQATYFRAGPRRRPGAVLVLPQWNADETAHVGLCRALNWVGLGALRLTLPYHERRMPPELQRADFIVSANIGRTLMVNRQAVLDARRAIHWLAARGYERIGILGTSLGSCLSMLTACHEPLVRAAALNHVSPLFADVVWDGLSTRHVRAGFNGELDLATLRQVWLPISPLPHIDRLRNTRTLLVYARYDLTFPLRLSQQLVEGFRARGVPHQVTVLPCGHYSTGIAPFKYLDGYVLTKFLVKALAAS
jgi:dienelactone hydrolase